MRFFTIAFFAIILNLLSTHNISAQEIIQRKCASDDIVRQYLLDNYSLDELRTATFSSVTARGAEDTTYSVPVVNQDTTYTIQVVVHVVYLDDNKYENPSDELIQSQIDALNRDFNLENDISHIRPEFMQFLGNAKIRFELAKTDPRGNTTTGITRKKSKPVLFPDWNPALDNVKNSSLGGVNPWSPKKYLNIWVCDLNMARRVKADSVAIDGSQGILAGVAQPPSGLPNWNMNILGQTINLGVFPELKQGVTIDFRFFGQHPEYVKDYFNNSDHYGLGRTTVHEVGHYLGLRHSWGDGSAYAPLFGGDECLDYDDGIKDTPSEKEPYSNYIESGNVCGVNVNSCDVPYPGDGIDYPDMRENYMNYSTDVCYGMFTREQVNMMRYALTQKRYGIITDAKMAVATSVRNQNSLQAQLYPNPTSNSITLKLSSNIQKQGQILIYNSLGSVVLSQEMYSGDFQANIDLQKLPSGVYMVAFNNGDQSFIEKLIKK